MCEKYFNHKLKKKEKINTWGFCVEQKLIGQKSNYALVKIDKTILFCLGLYFKKGLNQHKAHLQYQGTIEFGIKISRTLLISKLSPKVDYAFALI